MIRTTTIFGASRDHNKKERVQSDKLDRQLPVRRYGFFEIRLIGDWHYQHMFIFTAINCSVERIVGFWIISPGKNFKTTGLN